MSRPPRDAGPQEDEPPVPLAARLIFAALSLVLAFGLSEALIRVVDGGGLPHLRLFEVRDGLLVMQPEASATGRRVDGAVFTVHTDAHGLRSGPEHAPAPAGSWLVVGDSQVLGMGVAHGEAFAAGHHVAGVPGHGVVDALAHAEALVPALAPAGVVVVVNQANDWAEGLAPATERYAVHGGWLLHPDAGGTWFWASPLSRSHLLYLSSLVLRAGGPSALGVGTQPPDWLTDPQGQAPTSAALAERVAAFVDAHPGLSVLTVFLPVDLVAGPERIEHSAFRELVGDATPWEDSTLRDQLAAGLGTRPFLDLTPALAGAPEAFLPGDYHLSPAGHARVAAALAPILSSAPAPSPVPPAAEPTP